MTDSPSPPTGDITFLFTDVEGSTALWDRAAEAMSAALAEHDRRIRAIVRRRGGYVFTTAGDSFAVAFASAVEAVHAAFEIQLAMREPAGSLVLDIRAGLHSGEATVRDGDYFGPEVNRGARLASSAHGGQLVIAQSTVDRLQGALPDQAELLDLGAHRLRGLTDPVRIHQFCHPDLPRDFPRLRTVEGPADNLPIQLTSFVGRSRELAEVIELVAATRLVTISGAGGAGKTRLALRVAEALLVEFPDGMRFAELGAIDDPGVLVDEVAQRFSVTAIPGVPLIETLGEFIRDQRVLLVIDNCEHIVSPVAALCQQLLTACPNLHVLATSRERIGVAGEALYRVPSLSVPTATVSPEESLAFDGVRLFVERAQLAVPGFSVGERNVDDIISICRRLDGIPLAIELAAARTRSMSPAQIVSRLTERFRLLTATNRHASRRQETLLSTIEWSHDLLSPDERVLFRRLGVFAADFELVSAEQICVGGEVDELDVLELMGALVDKSMVATDSAGDGTTRFRLLETLREFARRELANAEERERVEHLHAEYFAGQAERLQTLYRQGQLAAAMVELDRDEAEFRAALRTSLAEPADLGTVARLVGGLGYLWYAGGQHREALQWCDALFAADPELSDELRAGALHSYASILSVNGQSRKGIDILEQQIEIRRRLGDRFRLGAALNNLGNLLHDVGDYQAAEPVLDEAIECLRQAGEPGPASLALSTLGNGRLMAGDFAGAEQSFRTALGEARTADDAHAIAVAMSGLGQTLAVTGRLEQARAQLVEARERFEELGVGPGMLEADLYLGLVERESGDRVAAARRFRSSLGGVGAHWSDDSDYWIMQLSAPVLDDRATSAVLLGAAATGYERADTRQPAFIAADFEAVRMAIEHELGSEDFGRQFRAGGRRTRTEAITIAEAALTAVMASTGATE
jgi:predicted ATPase/class 3 adenylate cyclase